MTRYFGAALLALAIALPALPVAAQTYPSSGPYYRSAPPAGPSYDDDDRAMYRPPAPGVRPEGEPSRILPYPDDVDAAPLPPPGFAATQRPADAYGSQPNPQQGPAAAAAPGVNPSGEPGVMRPPGAVGTAPLAPGATPPAVPPSATAALPPEDQPEQGPPQELPANLKRQLVDYNANQPAGTIIVDTANTYLYLVLGRGKALRYGIGVGREGFTWSGTERISRMKEWPDWFPPVEMIERQPYLPRLMAGGPGNPLGARALYLGKTLYRIHGTNQPSTIGKFVSSGCIRLLNPDIEDLYSRVQVGTRVVVLPGKPAPENVAAAAPPAPANPMAPPASTGAAGPNAAAISSSPLPPAR